MSISPGLAAFRLSFQLSPIIFTQGIATNIPGGILPIILITEALHFVEGLLGGADIDLDNFFANFIPLPGSTLAANEYGHYPFANQQIAANARIAQPKRISMRMICPARDIAGYALKAATMTALQAAIELHAGLGGTYTVATPSFTYTNCLLLNLTDTSLGNSLQAQNTYQWDFEQPLLTLQQAQQAQNGLMSQITNGTAINGAPSFSGLAATVGQPASLGAISTIPGATFLQASQSASPTIGIFQ